MSLQIVQQKSLTLNGKINHLKKSSSNDPLQQLQTDTIIDMYQIVREMQVFLDPLLLLYPANPFELNRRSISCRREFSTSWGAVRVRRAERRDLQQLRSRKPKQICEGSASATMKQLSPRGGSGKITLAETSISS